MVVLCQVLAEGELQKRVASVAVRSFIMKKREEQEPPLRVNFFLFVKILCERNASQVQLSDLFNLRLFYQVPGN